MDYRGHYDFSVLSIKDLIEARDQYHFHLMSKDNVVGTAVGSYLIRKTDPKDGTPPLPESKTVARTFANSEVRPYSWPCIIVLVREWLQEAEFGPQGKASPWQMIPKALFLSDGRAVPVCVVLTQPVAADKKTGSAVLNLPNAGFGGGLRLNVDVQQERRFGTVGCLVSDGHLTYALTARHVCGEAGTAISASLRGRLAPIGESSAKQLTRQLFSEVYPALPMRQTWLGIDVGLVKLDDITNWTPNVYGLPPLRPMLDLFEQNLSLRIIDQDVIAVGAASGLMAGKVKALFYRYRSSGGFDYVSDFLISPPDDGVGARHGDSGALWQIIEPRIDAQDQRPDEERLRPLAIEWGAQVFEEGMKRSSFSVASALSTVCRLLDVELVVPGDDSVSGTWGVVGHYSIGRLAVGLIKNPDLKALMEANIDAISVGFDTLKQKKALMEAALLGQEIVPLADVADIVWKKWPEGHVNAKGVDKGVKGGRDVAFNPISKRSTGPEHPQHHCDADLPFASKPTLRRACLDDPSLLSTSAWIAYYEARAAADGKTRAKPDYHSGVLPFRIWQFFEAMTGFAAHDVESFVGAAGLMAHYVGDASQPLHGSHLSDGDPTAVTGSHQQRHQDGTTTTIQDYRGAGVHSFFESDMLSYAAEQDQLLPAIENHLGAEHALPLVTDGRGAGLACLELMDTVASILSPEKLIDVYETVNPTHGKTKQALAAYWAAIGNETGQVMALGARYLAMMWDAAWVAGAGHDAGHGAIDPAAFKRLYEDVSFIKSYTIDDIGAQLGAEGNFVGAAAPTAKTKTAQAVKTSATTSAKRPARKRKAA